MAGTSTTNGGGLCDRPDPRVSLVSMVRQGAVLEGDHVSRNQEIRLTLNAARYTRRVYRSEP